MSPTKEQQAAIDSEHPRILCLASPGSGKTFVGEQRVRRLVKEGCDRDDIAVICYTNAAAREFEGRLATSLIFNPETSLGGNLEPITIEPITLGYVGTLHGFCLRHIQRFGDRPGPISVMDDEEADEALLRSAKESGVKAKPSELRACRANWIVEQHLPLTSIRISVGSYYNEMIRTNTFDYNSLLEHTLDLMQDLHRPQKFWEHLIVDEFHDANPIDAKIYSNAITKNRFFIADPDQACFSFRGGNVEQTMDLAENVHWEKRILSITFRCAPEICTAANKLIGHAADRVSKSMKPDRRPKEALERPASALTGGSADARSQGFDNAAIEALSIGGLLHHRAPDGENLDGYAVLCRTNRVADDIRNVLSECGVEVRAKLEFEVPDDWRVARAAVAFLANPKSVSVYSRLLRASHGLEAELWVQGHEKGLPLPSFTGDADKMEAELIDLGVSTASVELVQRVFHELPESASLADLSLALALSKPKDVEEGGGVTVTTIHDAKGREWDTVILAGFEDEIIPGNRKNLDVEEERRLAYVGMTRARKELIITWAERRPVTWGRNHPEEHAPSRFIEEAGL